MAYEDIKKAIEFQGLVVNRIPKKYKDLFKQLAKEEFADDYGQTIRSLLVSFFEYERLKDMFLNSELPIRIGLDKQGEIVEKENIKKNIRGEPIFKELKGGLTNGELIG